MSQYRDTFLVSLFSLVTLMMLRDAVGLVLVVEVGAVACLFDTFGCLLSTS